MAKARSVLPVPAELVMEVDSTFGLISECIAKCCSAFWDEYHKYSLSRYFL